MRVAMLTGGGDCPGLNAVMRAVVRKGERQFGDEMIGFLDGWRGVLDGESRPLDVEAMRGTLPRGGTVLGSSRTNPFKIEGGVERCRASLDALGIEALIAIGGDDTLGVADKLHDLGVPVVGVPKTIDNDLSATEQTFGFDTAVQIATEAIDRLHTTAESHHRVMVVEVMGRHAGHIALWSGIAGGATMILIPEEPFELDRVCDALTTRHALGNFASIVVVAEGATPAEGSMATVSGEVDAFGHVRLGGIAQTLAEQIEARTGFETRMTILGHVQRGGTPTAFDRVLATRFGIAAIDAVHDGAFGTMMALQGGQIVRVPLHDGVGQPKLVDPALYHGVAEVFFARLMELLTARDSEATQRRVAGALLARGLGPGDRVAMATSSNGATLSAILGALRVGIVPVVLNAGLLPHERAALLADARPDLEVDDAVLASLVEGPPAELAPVPLARPMHYTSGTSGTPKGVWSGVLDESSARALFDEEADLWGFHADDRHLVCSPLHHSAPIRFAAGTLLRGGSVVILGPFDAAVAAGAIASYRPTSAFMVPSHLQRLFARFPPGVPGGEAGDASSADGLDLSSFRLLAHAGAACPPSLKRAAIAAFPAGSVWEFYGSTEGQFTACPAAEWSERPGTVGRARPGRELRIDPDGTIWCAVPAHARFVYWDDPGRTAAAWREPTGGGSAGPTGGRAEGDTRASFTVGDLGRLDDDGYLWLDGRRDDLIITGGVNVYPVEVEDALAHAPGVEQVAVFGVDDESWGQRVCAAVVGPADPGEVKRYARTVLAAYKCPKDVYPVDALPHTSTGKVQRGALAGHLGLELR